MAETRTCASMATQGRNHLDVTVRSPCIECGGLRVRLDRGDPLCMHCRSTSDDLDGYFLEWDMQDCPPEMSCGLRSSTEYVLWHACYRLRYSRLARHLRVTNALHYLWWHVRRW